MKYIKTFEFINESSSRVNITGLDSGEIKDLKKTYNCDCGRLFNTNAGLWKHKKVCNNEDIKNNEKVYKLAPDENFEVFE